MLGIIPQGIAIIIVILRTYKEDKTLIDELTGYKEYTKKTSYRLIPRI
ncbi:MAG: hypothetical protein GF329_11910 [Candidatus Lokiarchaeota archaeon]|nr:hypothetical protein [Candidatus Lokiarchaeota archaeon]